jgi:hypothetical protein
MDAATKPATSIFLGDPGTKAANIRMTGPIQVIIASVSTGVAPGGPKWNMRAIPTAQATM